MRIKFIIGILIMLTIIGCSSKKTYSNFKDLLINETKYISINFSLQYPNETGFGVIDGKDYNNIVLSFEKMEPINQEITQTDQIESGEGSEDKPFESKVLKPFTYSLRITMKDSSIISVYLEDDIAKISKPSEQRYEYYRAPDLYKKVDEIVEQMILDIKKA